eukprot:1382004-Prymnesium_polylepis.1
MRERPAALAVHRRQEQPSAAENDTPTRTPSMNGRAANLKPQHPAFRSIPVAAPPRAPGIGWRPAR